ncbi:MAG: transporter associated domain-containing protein, partial [Saprospiraceae bacterium]|nr:transporter associated domain-containing protein [Saprospiraceae bacterium]
VYQETFDHITGILYVKDLIGHRKEGTDFQWQSIVRDQLLYVPESKKINELLKEFQLERVHMAIVVDEYGGSAGLVTLEDVMEEVIGEIKDEFDDAREGEYKEIDPKTFVFDGKVLINEACRAMGIDTNRLDGTRGDADSLAGLLLEINGEIPIKGQEFVVEGLQFIVLSVTKRRIEKIRIHITDEV